jgi:uncharacterized repeat protein (TIGR03803 family)
MKTTERFQTLLASLALTFIPLILTVSARAQTETVLFSFTGGTNGYNSVASLLLDSAGNLYGTTSEGGNSQNCSVGCGIVFQLSPNAGGWTENVPYAFLGGNNGEYPFVGVTKDAAGNLYGATGGGVPGNGTIFELSPNSGGGWNETTLHVFSGGRDGANPYGGLILDAAGSLYGTAHGGGQTSCGSGCGVVFKLSPTSTGWKETVLHAFSGKDGYHPSSGLIFDAAGNLYGTTTWGGPQCGSSGCGVVFELSPTPAGLWREKVLHAFSDGPDGAYPVTGLVFDTTGNLYGTTSSGGDRSHCVGAGCGVVFELSPTSSGPWKETVLHIFAEGNDGAIPSGVIFDSAGNLYGTTNEGGNPNICAGHGCGVAFELSPGSSGWTETVLHTFDNNAFPNDGLMPQAGVILDSAGNLYGTTPIGGSNGLGTVFEISP